MKWLLAIIVIVMMLGPLRRSVGRHWALLASVSAGAASGFLLGSFVLKLDPTAAYAPPLCALIVAIAAGRVGPQWLRQIEKDGRDEHPSRRR